MKERWVIIAEFITSAEDRWLDDFISAEDLHFTKLPRETNRGSWHSRNARITSFGEWVTHFRHARMAYRSGADGIIACFPQLAICLAFLKRFGRSKPKVIAYNFNLGTLRSGPRRWLARLCAQEVDVFVVHSPQEVQTYSEYLDVAPERVRFVPLQRGEIGIDRAEVTEVPFILAMGSAHRDYSLLIRAVEHLGLPTHIVTSADLIARLPKSPNVKFSSGLSEEECWRLLAGARLSVTPIANLTTASGQVTLVDALQMGVPVIATDCPGTNGYIENGRTGILVEPGNEESLKTEIHRLWNDPARRKELSDAGRLEASSRFSDTVAASTLYGLIRSLA